MMQLTTRCRYAGYDERGNPLPPDEDLGFQQSWCQTGSTCNLPWQDERDQLGLYELKERLRLDGILLQDVGHGTNGFVVLIASASILPVRDLTTISACTARGR